MMEYAELCGLDHPIAFSLPTLLHQLGEGIGEIPDGHILNPKHMSPVAIKLARNKFVITIAIRVIFTI